MSSNKRQWKSFLYTIQCQSLLPQQYLPLILSLFLRVCPFIADTENFNVSLPLTDRWQKNKIFDPKFAYQRKKKFQKKKLEIERKIFSYDLRELTRVSISVSVSDDDFASYSELFFQIRQWMEKRKFSKKMLEMERRNLSYDLLPPT